MRTDAGIIAQTEDLAREFARIDGWAPWEMTDFRDCRTARARRYWLMARTAQLMLTQTDPDDCE